MKNPLSDIQIPTEHPYDSVDAMLAEWRQRAIPIIMGTVTVVFLPLVIIICTGHGPAVTPFMSAFAMVTYALLALLNFVRAMNFRARAYACLTLGYVFVLFGTIALPHGPFMRAAPLFLPMFAMVLLGKRAGRVAGWLSLLLFQCTPMFSTMPATIRLLLLTPMELASPSNALWGESMAMSALLIAMMVLLDRFHDFLLQALKRLEDKSGKLVRSMTEGKYLERELIRVADDERRRLGQEIHDGVCQQLTGVLLSVGALSRRLGRNGAILIEDLGSLSSQVEETIDEARGVARGLCPLSNDANALAAALHVLAKRTSEASGIPVLFTIHGQVETADSTTANHLYRIAQEALSNALRHASPSQVKLTLRGEGRRLLLDVQDDGDGMPRDISAEGMGLRTMAHRAHLMEGDFSITGIQPRGTRVSCWVSREEPQPTGRTIQ